MVEGSIVLVSGRPAAFAPSHPIVQTRLPCRNAIVESLGATAGYELSPPVVRRCTPEPSRSMEEMSYPKLGFVFSEVNASRPPPGKKLATWMYLGG